MKVRKKKMKKESGKIEQLGRVAQSYHEGRGRTNYAFEGYNKNLFYASDRGLELDADFKPLKPGVIVKGFGIEEEIESWDIKGGCGSEQLAMLVHTICMQEYPKDLFKFQRDGSLQGGTSSIEVISQVMSKEFIRNNYTSLYRKYEYYKMYGIDATRSGNCGMHVNMSNTLFGREKTTQAENIKKLCYFVNRHYEKMCPMVKRDIDNNGYCEKMYDWENMDYAKRFNLDNMNEYDSNHYICFNLAHYGVGRVELRLVGGQKDYATYRNTMETIFWMVERIKTLSWEALNNFNNMWYGCNQYVVKRLRCLIDENLITSNELNEIIARMKEEDYSIEIVDGNGDVVRRV